MQVMRVLLSIGVKAVLDGPLEREAARERERQRVLRKLAARVRQRALVTLRQVRGNWSRSPGVARIRVWLRTTKVRGSRRDAGREVRRLLRVVDTGEHVDPNRITVRNWLTTWRYATRQEVAPRTAERYAEIVNNFLTLRSATCN